MNNDNYYEYRVSLAKDRETGQIIAEIPTLDISDFGADSQEAIESLEKMVEFHLECLVTEGKDIPEENKVSQGLYLRVKRPLGVS